jgi:uncharacterized protein involved in exopolysaccharide biosynthesis
MSTNTRNSTGLLLAQLESAPLPLDTTDEREMRRRRIDRYRILWTHRRFLVRVAAAALILSTAVAFAIPNQYESTTRLMPPDDTSSNMAMIAAAARNGISMGGIASNLLGLRSSGVLFVGVLQSRTVQDDLIDRFDLRNLYKHKKWIDTRKQLASRTAISEDHKNGIISITVTDREPQRAAAMAQEYVDELNRVVAQLSTSSARRERVFLEERLTQVNQELEAAEKNFSEFASKNTALDIKEQGRAMIDAGAALEGQMVAAQTELQALRQIYTNENVRVRETQARVDELERQLQKLGGESTGSGTSATGSDSIYPSIRKLPLLGVTYADLYREMKVKEVVFETLTQQYELAKVEEVKQIPSVRVLDAPEIPERKSFPHRLWTMMGGTALCLLFATFWIFGSERWTQLDMQDPSKVLAVEVLNAIQAKLPSRLTNDNGYRNASGNGNGVCKDADHAPRDSSPNGTKA